MIKTLEEFKEVLKEKVQGKEELIEKIERLTEQDFAKYLGFSLLRQRNPRGMPNSVNILQVAREAFASMPPELQEKIRKLKT